MIAKKGDGDALRTPALLSEFEDQALLLRGDALVPKGSRSRKTGLPDLPSRPVRISRTSGRTWIGLSQIVETRPKYHSHVPGRAESQTAELFKFLTFDPCGFIGRLSPRLKSSTCSEGVLDSTDQEEKLSSVPTATSLRLQLIFHIIERMGSIRLATPDDAAAMLEILRAACAGYGNII